MSHKGNWYLIGHDVDRDDTRMFKLARILDEPVPDGPAGAVVVPTPLDLRALAERLEPGQPTRVARIAIRSDRAPWLRRRGTPVAEPRRVPVGFDVVEVRFGALDTFAVELAGSGSDVIVLDPPELRGVVRRHLARVVEGHGAGDADRHGARDAEARP